MARQTETIRQTHFIPAPPDEVYDAYVDPARHAAFTGAEASSDREVGGRFTAHADYISGEILELVPGEKIVQAWTTTEWPEGAPPSRLEIRLASKDDGTELTMVHSEVPAEQADSYRQGWIDHYWKPLQRYFSQAGA